MKPMPDARPSIFPKLGGAISWALSLVLLGACPADDRPPEASTSGSSASDTSATGPSESDTSTTEPSTSTETDPSTTTDDGTTEGPAVCEPLPDTTDDCCCFSTLGEGLISIDNACPVDMLCEFLTIECSEYDDACPVGSGNESGTFTVRDEARLDCVLTALRDGQPGSLVWMFTGSEEPGFSQLRHTVHILPDRRVITDTLMIEGQGGPWSDVTEQTLREADEFTACMQGGDVASQVSCLEAPTDGEVIEVCTEGGLYEAP